MKKKEQKNNSSYQAKKKWFDVKFKIFSIFNLTTFASLTHQKHDTVTKYNIDLLSYVTGGIFSCYVTPTVWWKGLFT